MICFTTAKRLLSVSEVYYLYSHDCKTDENFNQNGFGEGFESPCQFRGESDFEDQDDEDNKVKKPDDEVDEDLNGEVDEEQNEEETA